MPTYPVLAAQLYFSSCFLDAMDGFAARYLKQQSKFGAALDMVTDRCTTAALMVYLGRLIPQYTSLFQGLIAIDLSSHYLQMLWSMHSGSASHKQATSFWLLKIYYENRSVLFWLCAANEMFWLSMFLEYSISTHTLYRFLGMQQSVWFFVMWFTLPFCTLKNFINMVQLVFAVDNLVQLDSASTKSQKAKDSDDEDSQVEESQGDLEHIIKNQVDFLNHQLESLRRERNK